MLHKDYVENINNTNFKLLYLIYFSDTFLTNNEKHFWGSNDSIADKKCDTWLNEKIHIQRTI